MKRPHAKGRKPAPQGRSQRQLRAGELVRHAIINILYEEELRSEVMAGVSVTVTEVRISPDLRNASVFVEPLGGANADEIVKALNQHTGFLRGRLGHAIDMKFVPALKFLHDQSFAEAERMARLFDHPRIREDLAKTEAPAEEAPPAPVRRVTPKVPGSKTGFRTGGVKISAPKDDDGA
jgi:ribosome-binding factor A